MNNVEIILTNSLKPARAEHAVVTVFVGKVCMQWVTLAVLVKSNLTRRKNLVTICRRMNELRCFIYF